MPLRPWSHFICHTQIKLQGKDETMNLTFKIEHAAVLHIIFFKERITQQKIVLIVINFNEHKR